ncbi:hypothetical protein [Sphingobium herbicidovorans]|nr:hypothetical protein [Sphingobium herbicidovorans]
MTERNRIMPPAAKWMLIPVLLGSATSALAAPEPSTRLVECSTGDCLLVTGRRDDRHAPVSINGHEIAVKGDCRWQARLPVETFRAWSAPNARTVTVSVDGEETKARLPVGMFVRPEKLTMLVIRPK